MHFTTSARKGWIFTPTPHHFIPLHTVYLVHSSLMLAKSETLFFPRASMLLGQHLVCADSFYDREFYHHAHKTVTKSKLSKKLWCHLFSFSSFSLSLSLSLFVSIPWWQSFHTASFSVFIMLSPSFFLLIRQVESKEEFVPINLIS